jgi:hypothetical protein
MVEEPVERVYERVQYIPVETQIVHYPERDNYVPAKTQVRTEYVGVQQGGVSTVKQGSQVETRVAGGNYVSGGSGVGVSTTTYQTQPVSYTTGATYSTGGQVVGGQYVSGGQYTTGATYGTTGATYGTTGATYTTSYPASYQTGYVPTSLLPIPHQLEDMSLEEVELEALVVM